MPAVDFYFIIRKLIHIISGLLFVWCTTHCPRPEVTLTVLILGVVLLDKGRQYSRLWDKWFLKIFQPFLKYSESQGGLTGATTLWVALYLVFILFPGTIFLPAALIVILADPAGALAGKAIGTKKVYRQKTWEGSLVFVIVSLGILWQYQNIPLIPAVFICIILGITEVMAPEKYENIFITFMGAILIFISSIIG